MTIPTSRLYSIDIDPDVTSDPTRIEALSSAIQECINRRCGSLDLRFLRSIIIKNANQMASYEKGASTGWSSTIVSTTDLAVVSGLTYYSEDHKGHVVALDHDAVIDLVDNESDSSRSAYIVCHEMFHVHDNVSISESMGQHGNYNAFDRVRLLGPHSLNLFMRAFRIRAEYVACKQSAHICKGMATDFDDLYQSSRIKLESNLLDTGRFNPMTPLEYRIEYCYEYMMHYCYILGHLVGCAGDNFEALATNLAWLDNKAPDWYTRSMLGSLESSSILQPDYVLARPEKDLIEFMDRMLRVHRVYEGLRYSEIR